MIQVNESDRMPLEFLKTPKIENPGDELKVWAVKDRQWLDITSWFLSPGTISQYLRGDKTWQDFAASVRSSLLTGLGSPAGTISAGDSVLQAFGKAQAQMNRDFMLRSNSALTVDPNTLFTSGGWRVAAHVNNPTNTIYSYLVYGNQSTVTAQIATRVVTGETYVRTYNTSWSSWVQLTGGGDVTKAGNNAFTGVNSFTTPPTSASDATTANQLVRFSQLPFLQKFVRTQSGTYNPTVTGTTENNLFETNFGWLGINNAESRIIKIRLVTQLNASSGSDVTFTLKIGATAYSTVTISPAATTEAVVEYVLTFGASNSKKIIGTVMEEITGFKMGTNLVTIDMSSNLDIFIAGTFLTSDGANGFSVSQVTVEVV